MQLQQILQEIQKVIKILETQYNSTSEFIIYQFYNGSKNNYGIFFFIIKTDIQKSLQQVLSEDILNAILTNRINNHEFLTPKDKDFVSILNTIISTSADSIFQKIDAINQLTQLRFTVQSNKWQTSDGIFQSHQASNPKVMINSLIKDGSFAFIFQIIESCNKLRK